MTDTAGAEQLEFGRGGGVGGAGGEQGGGEGDRRALQAFLQNLADDLKAMISEEDFLTSHQRGRALEAFAAGPRDEVAEMIRRLDDREVEDDLTRHGLTGVQLRFKLGVHGFARRQTLGAIANGTISASAADVAGEEYLKCSDVILESLSGALGGAGAALIEFKKMIEWLKGFVGRFGFRF